MELSSPSISWPRSHVEQSSWDMEELDELGMKSEGRKLTRLLKDSEPYAEISYCFPTCNFPLWFVYFCTKETYNWLPISSRWMVHCFSLFGNLRLCRNWWREVGSKERENSLGLPLSLCKRKDLLTTKWCPQPPPLLNTPKKEHTHIYTP